MSILASVTVAQPAEKMRAKAKERTLDVRDFIGSESFERVILLRVIYLKIGLVHLSASLRAIDDRVHVIAVTGVPEGSVNGGGLDCRCFLNFRHVDIGVSNGCTAGGEDKSESE